MLVRGCPNSTSGRRPLSQPQLCDRLIPRDELLHVHRLRGVWTEEECIRVLTTLKRVTDERGWSTTRHRAFNTTDIQSCDVDWQLDQWIRSSIRKRVFPEMVERFFWTASLVEKCCACCDERKESAVSECVNSSRCLTLRFRDLFFVKYEARDGEQTDLPLHRDGSLLSFNILLNSETEFEGGGTLVKPMNKVFHLQRGDAFLHSGQVLHGGNAVTKGVRYILVGFVDVIR